MPAAIIPHPPKHPIILIRGRASQHAVRRKERVSGLIFNVIYNNSSYRLKQKTLFILWKSPKYIHTCLLCMYIYIYTHNKNIHTHTHVYVCVHVCTWCTHNSLTRTHFWFCMFYITVTSLSSHLIPLSSSLSSLLISFSLAPPLDLSLFLSRAF